MLVEPGGMFLSVVGRAVDHGHTDDQTDMSPREQDATETGRACTSSSAELAATVDTKLGVV